MSRAQRPHTAQGRRVAQDSQAQPRARGQDSVDAWPVALCRTAREGRMYCAALDWVGLPRRTLPALHCSVPSCTSFHGAVSSWTIWAVYTATCCIGPHCIHCTALCGTGP